MDAFEKAVREVAETGTLSFAARRKLWLAFGPWEERDEMDKSPHALTEPLRKRGELALACAKKVGKVWSAYDVEDKGPQELLKKTNAYLKGKLEADQLYQAWKASDYMVRVEDERYSSAPMAALAAERAAVVPYYDEFLLEPRYAGADDDELDPYDWDTAWCAALAWSGRDENAGGGQQKVEEMKFWAWYLEQAAQLLRVEDFKFPKKAIKDLEEKQELARPVPEEVTLENLADFLGQGKYSFHYRIRNAFGDGTILGDEDHGYDIYTICQKPEGVCPKCGTHVTKAKFWYGVNALEAMVPGTDVSIRVLHTLPMFHCPKHPDTSFTPREDYINPKAALKRFLDGPGRAQALLDQLENRLVNVFRINLGAVALNGDLQFHHAIRIPAEVQGVRWLDPEAEEVPLDMGKLGRTSYLTGMTTEELEIDLKQFGPHVYFHDMSLEEFCRAYPETVERMEDGSLRLTMERHWVRCWLDEAGNLERVVIQSRFHLELEKGDSDLRYFLMTEHHLTKEQADEKIAFWREKKKPKDPLEPLDGLTRAEAFQLRAALRSHGIKCRIMPVPVGESVDAKPW